MQISHHREFDINLLNVALPCPVTWESMHGDDRSRTCDECHRRIYNLAGMSKDEISRLILGSTDRPCVRLVRRSDGTVMTADCPKGLAAYRKRVTKFAGTVFAAILGLISAASGQRLPANDSQGILSETSISVPMIRGTVQDTQGMPIPSAVIKIATSSGKVLETGTDKNGRFRLISSLLDRGRNRISITANYFRSYRDEFSLHPREMLDYSVTLDAGETTGVIEILSPPMIDPRKSSITTTIRVDRD